MLEWPDEYKDKGQEIASKKFNLTERNISNRITATCLLKEKGNSSDMNEASLIWIEAQPSLEYEKKPEVRFFKHPGHELSTNLWSKVRA